MKIPLSIKGFWGRASIMLVPFIVLVAALALGFSFFTRGRDIMQEQLRDHLRTTAAVAALAIDPQLVSRVRDEEDMKGPAYVRLLKQIQDVRSSDPKILYAYIMRRTGDANVLSFVVDADNAVPRQQLDRDGNGVVEDDEEPALTGELYDATGEEFSVLRIDAFLRPSADTQITQDKWGTYISGYAPIRDSKGNVVAVLGIDMDAGEFLSISQSIFSPIALLLLIIAGILLAVYIQYMWHRRSMDTMKQLDGERTALLDLATHQLGMPLATFKWWLEILRDKDNGAFCEKNGICDEMQHGIDRMDTIISSLHDANHLQKGSLNYHPTSTVLADVIAESIASMKEDLAKSRQTIDFEQEGDIPELSIDPKLIGGVISELIENAHMYSPNGAAITIRLFRNRGSAMIDVIDHGYGISADEVKSVFEKFKRGKDAMKYKPVGNGLGLFIARGIIEQAGGSISLKSKPGQGTSIRIILPLP